MTIGQSDQATKTILHRKGMTNPTTKQLEKAKKGSRGILCYSFHISCRSSKYGKVVEDMENDVLKKKENLFPKDVSAMSRLLIGWRNNFGGRSVRTEANGWCGICHRV